MAGIDNFVTRRLRSAHSLELLAFTIVFAAVGLAILNYLAPNPLPMMEYRETELLKATEGLRQHGLPLYFETSNGIAQPIGGADFKGFYLLTSYLAVLLGIDDPMQAWRLIWLFLWMVVLVGAPFFISTLTSSRLAIYGGSVALLYAVTTIEPLDIYWVQAWAILALMPPVMFIWRKKDFGKPDVACLILVALVAGLVSLVRDPAGIPVLIAAAAVMWIRSNSKPVGIGLIGLLALAYLCTSTLVLDAVIALRDSHSDIDPSRLEGNAGQTLWHSIYIGLGYLRNDHGIYYQDEVAAAAAKVLAPGAHYHSKAYNEALRGEVFRIASHEPFFILGLLFKKACVVFYLVFRYLLVIAVGLPALLASQFARLSLLLIPAAAIGVLPAFLGVPTEGYLYGLIGALILVGMLGIVVLLDRADASWSGSSDRGFRQRVRVVLANSFPTENPGRLLVTYLIVLVISAGGYGLGYQALHAHQDWTVSQQKLGPPHPLLQEDR